MDLHKYVIIKVQLIKANERAIIKSQKGINRKLNKDYFENYVGDLRINIPISMIKDKEVRPIDIVIYGIIDQLSYKKGYAWISNNSLAKMIQTSTKTVQTSINKLVNKNYLIKTKLVFDKVERRRLTPTKTIMNINLDKQRKESEKIEEQELKLFEYDWIEDLRD